jgi:hypothetical protein
VTPGLVQHFLDVRQQVDRSAFNRFKKSRGVAVGDAEAAKAAFEAFRQLRPLDDDALRYLARDLLDSCCGVDLTGEEPFPGTLWLRGARHTKGGRPFLGSIRTFTELLLPERARAVNPPEDPKRGGWVFEPTTNPTGVRENNATLAMHALFLDCDDAGQWDWLNYELALLAETGCRLYRIFYQSGGWTPATPKWRVIFPLARPFDVSTEERRDTWKVAYNHARVLFGALGHLGGVGFDPATETPCNPWFLTERRATDDPMRVISWAPGRSLDLELLSSLLPAPTKTLHEDVDRETLARISITEERFEEIVDALTAATTHVPAGRRDIYLAMPAVLLNRGLEPDDVRRIVAEVSSRYPRVHKDKHEDNLHCAETTIERWEEEGAGARITQIGTLQAHAPEVAAALDEVIPNPSDKGMLDAITAQLGNRIQPQTSAPPAVPSPYTAAALQGPHASALASIALAPRQPAAVPAPKIKPKRTKMSPLAKKLGPIAKKLTEHKVNDRKIEGGLLLIMLRQEPLPGNAFEAAKKLAGALGYRLATDTPWLQALELMGPSLLLTGIAQSAELVKQLEAAFVEGRGRREKSERKRAAKKLLEKEKQALLAREVY